MNAHSPIRVALIGYGYWGPNLARNLQESALFELVGIYDQSEDQRKLIKRRFPSIQVFEQLSDILSDEHIAAVVIATPPSTHFSLAMQGLNGGKHVLVEKPITLDSLEAIQLIHTAEKHDLQLMVDHTFVYSPPVQFLYESIAKNGLGSLHAFDSTRINLGLIQKDTNVIWDLAVHDISIVNYITGRLPVSVSATGAKISQSDQHVTGYLSLFYDDGFIAHINVSWFSPVKIRRTIVTGQNKMIVYDDLETSEKIKVYDSGVDVQDDPESIQKLLVSYRVGDIMSPLIPQREALSLMVESFAKSISANNPSPTSGLFGLKVVQIVEATIRSLHSNGSNMLIEYSL